MLLGDQVRGGVAVAVPDRVRARLDLREPPLDLQLGEELKRVLQELRIRIGEQQAFLHAVDERH